MDENVQAALCILRRLAGDRSLLSLVVDGDGGNALTLPFLTGASQCFRHCSVQHERRAAHEIERPFHLRAVSTSRIPRTQEHVRVSRGDGPPSRAAAGPTRGRWSSPPSKGTRRGLAGDRRRRRERGARGSDGRPGEGFIMASSAVGLRDFLGLCWPRSRIESAFHQLRVTFWHLVFLRFLGPLQLPASLLQPLDDWRVLRTTFGFPWTSASAFDFVLPYRGTAGGRRTVSTLQ